MKEQFTQRLKKIEDVLTKKLPENFSSDWQWGFFNTSPNNEFSQNEVEKLVKPCRELLSLGGKRWRPLLQVLCAEYVLLNGEEKLDESQKNTMLDNAYNLVPLVEFVHTASLIHDDIEDGADTRRGKPATHITYGVDVAINAGSWLYFAAPEVLETLPLDDKLKISLYRTFMTELRRLHLGQSMDINWHKNKAYIPSKDEYMTMVGLKTGTLASLSAKIGMISGGASEEDAGKMAEIARKIGIGFQVLDDVINLTTGNKGKKRGDDVVEGKKSLPVILHVESKPEDLEKLVACFEKAGKEGPESPAVEECIEMLNSSGAIEKAKSISRELIETACSEVKSFYQNAEIGALIAELFVSMLI